MSAATRENNYGTHCGLVVLRDVVALEDPPPATKAETLSARINSGATSGLRVVFKNSPEVFE